jgi:putative transposase
LVRYIHLNPVRAKMVSKPEQYPYSGHCAYLGLTPPGIVDVDPVLRHFGAKKKVAREAYRQFVGAGLKLGHREDLYLAEEGRFLGNEEFVDATIHRIGETKRLVLRGDQEEANKEFNANALIEAVERICRTSREEFCSPSKNGGAVKAKEMFVVTGWQMGASPKLLSEITGMSRSAVSRRNDAAKSKVRENREINTLAVNIRKEYRQCLLRIAKSQA